MRIEVDDATRPEVLALLEEHLRSMYELSPPDQVFAFDASKLRARESHSGRLGRAKRCTAVLPSSKFLQPRAK